MPVPDRLVSVIIPTYNRWSLLKEAVESVLAQTYPAIELIVVDDGSTDGTLQNLLALANGQPKGRMRVLTQPNRGGTAARNAGLEAARGAYLTLLDHDDLLSPDKIERQVRYLERHLDLGGVYCRWTVVGEQGQALETIGELPDGDVLEALFLGCFLWSGAPLVRRSWMNQVGELDPAIWSSDWDLWLRLAGAGCRFGCLQVPLGAYRMLPDSTMADVRRTESADRAIFEKALSGRYAARLRPLEGEALSNWYFWLSHRYAATGSWQDAGRCLAEAVRLFPRRLQPREAFLKSVAANALDVRVDDPCAYIDGWLAHLAGQAQVSPQEAGTLRGQVLAGAAFRLAGRGHLPEAIRLLQSSFRIDPALQENPEQLAPWLTSYALRQPAASFVYLTRVFDILPLDRTSVEKLRRRVVNDVQMGLAFRHFHAGERRQAVNVFAQAVRGQPAWLRKRGVRALLVRLLTGWGG